jgi:serine/threonine protein kinase
MSSEHEPWVETASFDMRPAAAGRMAEADGGATGDWPAIPGYEILAQLPSGGMGVVYRARQVEPDRIVALKMIRTGIHAAPQERARFRVEAEAVASLSHPHIIQIYDCGECKDMPYLAMEFAEGGSLTEHLEKGRLRPEQAAELLETLARTMQFVHERGIIHRDLKPANVLLAISDQQSAVSRRRNNPSELTTDPCPLTAFIPKIADFGLAKRLDRDEGLTRSQTVLGTASYMAPEQAAGDTHAIGAAADIYALGAILYEALTARPPFRGETRELTIHQVLSEDPLPPGRLRADIPAELEAICLRCLEKESGRRFASAGALAEDLRRYRKGEPISIPAWGVFERHARAARRSGYEILETLAGAEYAGGGIAYKARHLALNRTVVLEMIASRPLSRSKAAPAEPIDSTRLERLRAEALKAAQLHHPNIVELYDFGDLNGEPFIAREYVEGGRLARGLAGSAQPPEQTAALVETLARAVHHAHLQGIVHGNLSISSVLLGGDGACKITGFGLMGEAKPTEPAGALDVYAIGAILYEMLTGRGPIAADPGGITSTPDRPGTPGSPRHARPELPRELETICLKCLDADPGARYPSAAAVAEDLRRFRTGEVLFMDNLDEPAQQQRWARRAGFEILELLGEGADGFTYKARQIVLDRIVVLKRITSRYRFVPGAKDRFRWEARLLSRLHHPNFVQVYDQGEQNDLTYFAREFVDGRSLTDMVAPDLRARSPSQPGLRRQSGRSGARTAAILVETLARAVHAAHGLGIVHGGLTPSIVRLTSAGLPKITSFHRARLMAGAAEEARPESDICRLACYLAPEQLEGKRRPLVPATDIYALGAILYTLLTGQPPFAGHSLEETLSLVRTQTPVVPRDRVIPHELATICMGCLEKLPADRPATAEAVADELNEAVL